LSVCYGKAYLAGRWSTWERVFEVTLPPSSQRTRVIVECAGPPELLERIQIRLVKLADEAAV
jgi:hypothetical protein